MVAMAGSPRLTITVTPDLLPHGPYSGSARARGVADDAAPAVRATGPDCNRGSAAAAIEHARRPFCVSGQRTSCHRFPAPRARAKQSLARACASRAPAADTGRRSSSSEGHRCGRLSARAAATADGSISPAAYIAAPSCTHAARPATTGAMTVRARVPVPAHRAAAVRSRAGRPPDSRAQTHRPTTAGWWRA